MGPRAWNRSWPGPRGWSSRVPNPVTPNHAQSRPIILSVLRGGDRPPSPIGVSGIHSRTALFLASGVPDSDGDYLVLDLQPLLGVHVGLRGPTGDDWGRVLGKELKNGKKKRLRITHRWKDCFTRGCEAVFFFYVFLAEDIKKTKNFKWPKDLSCK